MEDREDGGETGSSNGDIGGDACSCGGGVFVVCCGLVLAIVLGEIMVTYECLSSGLLASSSWCTARLKRRQKLGSLGTAAMVERGVYRLGWVFG